MIPRESCHVRVRVRGVGRIRGRRASCSVASAARIALLPLVLHKGCHRERQVRADVHNHDSLAKCVNNVVWTSERRSSSLRHRKDSTLLAHASWRSSRKGIDSTGQVSIEARARRVRMPLSYESFQGTSSNLDGTSKPRISWPWQTWLSARLWTYASMTGMHLLNRTSRAADSTQGLDDPAALEPALPKPGRPLRMMPIRGAVGFNTATVGTSRGGAARSGRESATDDQINKYTKHKGGLPASLLFCRAPAHAAAKG
jgi:hypothetical protein